MSLSFKIKRSLKELFIKKKKTKTYSPKGVRFVLKARRNRSLFSYYCSFRNVYYVYVLLSMCRYIAVQ